MQFFGEYVRGGVNPGVNYFREGYCMELRDNFPLNLGHGFVMFT